MRALWLAAIAAFFVSTPAAAQQMCAPHDAVLKSWAERFNERPVAVGLSDRGYAVEVLAAPDGSFSIFAVTPDGNSCLLAAGEGWQTIETPAPLAPGRDG